MNLLVSQGNYAIKICEILDKDQVYFGNRILTSDEQETRSSKTISRLFPFERDFVVVVDDRSDIWKEDPANLYKIHPFLFFNIVNDQNPSNLLSPSSNDFPPHFIKT